MPSRKVLVSFGNVAECRYTTWMFRGDALKLVIHFQSEMSSHRGGVNNKPKSRWTNQEECPRGVYWSADASAGSVGTSLRARPNYRGTPSKHNYSSCHQIGSSDFPIWGQFLLNRTQKNNLAKHVHFRLDAPTAVLHNRRSRYFWDVVANLITSKNPACYSVTNLNQNLYTL